MGIITIQYCPIIVLFWHYNVRKYWNICSLPLNGLSLSPGSCTRIWQSPGPPPRSGQDRHRWTPSSYSDPRTLHRTRNISTSVYNCRFFGIFFQFNKSMVFIFFITTFQRDFWLPVFLHNSSLPGPLSNGLKYFRFSISSYSIFRFDKIDSPEYHTPPPGNEHFFYPRTFSQIKKCSPP